MNQTLKIEIHQQDTAMESAAACIILLGIAVILYGIKHSFWILGCGVLLFCASVCMIAAIRRPTVIEADSSQIRWQQSKKRHQISLDSITAVQCQSYEVYARGGQHIRLRVLIRTNLEEYREIEFNDRVDAVPLLDDKLSGSNTDIPLMQLTGFLADMGCPIAS